MEPKGIAVKDLTVGALVQLDQDGSVGKITMIEPFNIVEGATIIVEWIRTDNSETGRHIGHGDDKVLLAD